MSRHPDLRDLVGNDLEPGEQERLERVHDMLIAAGPPPELPQELAEPPRPEGKLIELARRRLRTGLVLAAAIVLAAFAVGYFLGARGEESNPPSFTPTKQVVLGKSAGQFAVVGIGDRDSSGNWPMRVQVGGLDRLPKGDYYTLFMTRNGRPIVTCGTFNVSKDGLTTVSFSIAYDIDRFDGLMLAKYSRAKHSSEPLLRASL